MQLFRLKFTCELQQDYYETNIPSLLQSLIYLKRLGGLISQNKIATNNLKEICFIHPIVFQLFQAVKDLVIDLSIGGNSIRQQPENRQQEGYDN